MSNPSSSDPTQKAPKPPSSPLPTSNPFPGFLKKMGWPLSTATSAAAAASTSPEDANADPNSLTAPAGAAIGFRYTVSPGTATSTGPIPSPSNRQNPTLRPRSPNIGCAAAATAAAAAVAAAATASAAWARRKAGSPCPSGDTDDECDDHVLGWEEREKLHLARAILAQAEALPLPRRHELLASAANLTELAAAFAQLAPPGRGGDGGANIQLQKPIDDKKARSRELKRKVKMLAETVMGAAAPGCHATAVQVAPASAAAELPTAVPVEDDRAAAAAAAAEAADALTVTVIPEYDQYGVVAEEGVRAVVSIKAIAEVPKRAQVALTCVLDRSGSMSGEPMQLVRDTCHFLIDQLTDEDYLGLVSYSDGVRVDLPLLRMTPPARALAHRVVAALDASGSTALYDGLVAGVRQQMEAEMELRGAGAGAGAGAGVSTSTCLGERVVHSCFLFTDGQATDGPCSATAIISGLTQLQAPSGQHVTVHTFGFGSGHSVSLLQQVAEAQNGVYYYIQSTEDIASGFGDALGGLLAVVAKNVQVEVRPRPGVALTAFRSGGQVIGGTATAAASTTPRHSRRPPAAAAAAAGPTGAAFNDMFAEESRECLLVLNLPAVLSMAAGSVSEREQQEQGQLVAEVDLSYTDMATGARLSRRGELFVRRVAAPRPTGSLPAELVFVTAARFETLDAIEAAQAAAEAGPGDDVSGAHKVLDEQIGRLAAAPLRSAAISALVEQTRVARRSITPRVQMSQTGRAAVAGTVQVLRNQRLGTSTAAAPVHYAQYDFKCKSASRRTARMAVSGGYNQMKAPQLTTAPQSIPKKLPKKPNSGSNNGSDDDEFALN